MNAEADVLERADAAFAEAFAEALDIREHETGAHSKRVACHTLVVQAFLAEETTLREMVAAKCMPPNDPDIFDETKHLIHTLERNK